MPTLRVVLAPFIGLFVAQRLQGLRNRQSLVVESPLSDDALRAELRRHTIVHLGGQHRGGTTVLLEGLAAHPQIAVHNLSATARRAMEEDHQRKGRRSDGSGSGSGSEATENADVLLKKLHGEGIFLQDVYPKSSLDHQPTFFLRRHVSRFVCAIAPSVEQIVQLRFPSAAADMVLPWVGCTLREGIGGYALSQSSRLEASNALAGEAGALRLFRQWAPHWDLGRPVLVEKSPSNARAIGLLSTMWAGRAASCAFVFISRHPLAQAFAMLTFVEPADVTLHSQLSHYLAVEETIQQDARRHLQSVALLITSSR